MAAGKGEMVRQKCGKPSKALLRARVLDLEED
jgi:hypothetical protein